MWARVEAISTVCCSAAVTQEVSQFKKQKRRFDCSNQRLCYSFLFTEVFEKGWRRSHVHVPAADLYPDNALRRAVPGQHPN
jgi:hypothetical protein